MLSKTNPHYSCFWTMPPESLFQKEASLTTPTLSAFIPNFSVAGVHRQAVLNMTRKQPKTGPTQRQLRVGEEIRRTVHEILMRAHWRDPLLVDQSISVTGVRISPDLSVVTLFVKPLAAENELEIVAALNNAKGYVRGELGHALNHLRIVPQLRFEIDRSFDEGAHIDALLRSREVARDLAPHDEDDDDKDA